MSEVGSLLGSTFRCAHSNVCAAFSCNMTALYMLSTRLVPTHIDTDTHMAQESF